ncbi:MAG: response regulator [Verrucomicrobiota bacterium]
MRGIRALIVDDDPISAKLLALILSGEGCDVRVASEAEEALRIAATFVPRVIVVDLMLPGMSGAVLTELFRVNPLTRSATILIVTAFDGLATERLALAAGGDAYVRKPIDALAFPSLLRGLLASKGE